MCADLQRVAQHGFGFGTVVYLAALTSIDPGLYEAALIDGANRWKQTIYITLPLLAPTIVLMSVLSLGNVMGFAIVAALLNLVVTTALGAIIAVLYNLSVKITGGLLVGFTNN